VGATRRLVSAAMCWSPNDSFSIGHASCFVCGVYRGTSPIRKTMIEIFLSVQGYLTYRKTHPLRTLP